MDRENLLLWLLNIYNHINILFVQNMIHKCTLNNFKPAQKLFGHPGFRSTSQDLQSTLLTTQQSDRDLPRQRIDSILNI